MAALGGLLSLLSCHRSANGSLSEQGRSESRRHQRRKRSAGASNSVRSLPSFPYADFSGVPLAVALPVVALPGLLFSECVSNEVDSTPILSLLVALHLMPARGARTRSYLARCPSSHIISRVPTPLCLVCHGSKYMRIRALACTHTHVHTHLPFGYELRR